jgi:hypothetical protein
MSTKYTPGAVTTVAELAVNDFIFLGKREGLGLPVPTHPARVTEVQPTTRGTVLVHVLPANVAIPMESQSLGYLPGHCEVRRAVPSA